MDKDEKKSSNNTIQKLELTTKPSSTPLKVKIISCAIPDLILCDESASIHCISYNKQLNTFLKKDNFIMIINYLTKMIDGNLTVLITESTKVFLTTEFKIKKEILEKAQTLPSTHLVTIQQAKQSPKKRKLSIEGKVIQVSPIKMVKNDKIELKKITVKDMTDTVQVSLWKDQAHLNVNEGKSFTFKSLQTSTFKQKPVLSSTSSTTIEPSQNQDLDLISDDDFDEDDPSDQGEIVAVEKLLKYDACRDESCRLKKLDDNVCPKCYKSYADETAKQAVVLTVGLMNDDKFSTYTLFTTTFEHIFPKIDYENNQKQDIIQEILKLLPVNITFKANGDIITEANTV